MGKAILVYTKYDSGNEFGGQLEVTSFNLKNPPSPPGARMVIKIDGIGSIAEAQITLDKELAATLARTILNVLDGKISEAKFSY